MKIQLKLARKCDKYFLYELNSQAYQDLVNKMFGKWDADFQNKHFEEKWKIAEYKIVEADKWRVGVVWREEKQSCIFLHELQILPIYQGLGIGSSIIADTIELAQSKQKPVVLSVAKLNRVRYLYERFGFLVCTQNESHITMKRPYELDYYST